MISNPYLTTLAPEQIKDENGRVRDFLAQSAPASMEQTIALVNGIEPDALVILGSLTWSGSPDDCRQALQYLKQLRVPALVTGGHRDELADGGQAFRETFAKLLVANQVKFVAEVALAFAGDLDRDPDAATQRLESQLAEVRDAQAVLLFSGMDNVTRSLLKPDHKTFWALVDQHKIAARLDPTRYIHQLNYTHTLPVWSAASTGWSAKGAISLIRVYADRIELAEIADTSSPPFALTIPNPVRAARMPAAADDPYGCPSYSADLAQRPNFTFALVSDPQFDREAGRDALIAKAQAAIAELNRLNPALVFVAGDLVNNNLPEEWELFNKVFAELKPPRHVVPGNHDVLFNYDFVEQSYSSAPKQKPEYAAIVAKALAEARQDGFTGPAALYEKFTGSKPQQLVEYRDCAFVTVPFLTTRADPEQIEFLRKQLEQTGDKQHVFVVAHYPSLPAFGNNLQPQLGGSDVLALLHQHRVTGYLFGHRHRNGFRMHERTAHVLTDNMGTIHLLHVFDDRVVVGRKRVGSPLYEKLTVPSPRG